MQSSLKERNIPNDNTDSPVSLEEVQLELEIEDEGD